MSKVFLPVEPQLGMTSAERADAIDKEVYNMVRPVSVKSPNDVMYHFYDRLTHPVTGQVAVFGYTEGVVYIHPDVDLTDLLALLPEVPQAEKDGLVMFIDANRGGSVPFGQLIPSTSTQLTDVEAKAEGWLPDDPL
jgi:hypothetical protein